jgi:hypothetical protein
LGSGQIEWWNRKLCIGTCGTIRRRTMDDIISNFQLLIYPTPGLLHLHPEKSGL